jgi:predicted transcriptional regulator
MARNWGNIRLAAACIGLALFCVIAYYFLLYLVTPHPAAVDYPVASGLPPGARAADGGYVVFMSGYDVNLTEEQKAAAMNSSGEMKQVGFLDLPLWIQLYALPGMIVGFVASLFAAAFVIRRTRKNENDNKRAVLTFIEDNPGCTAPELARERNMNIGTVRYYIQLLRDESRIVLRKFGKFSRIFVNSHTYDDREKLIASHLRSDTSRLILGKLMETPGISNQMLADKLGMEKSLVYRYVQGLLDDGIITYEWEGKSKLYYISASAKEPLIKLMPLHYQCPGLLKDPKI